MMNDELYQIYASKLLREEENSAIDDIKEKWSSELAAGYYTPINEALDPFGSNEEILSPRVEQIFKNRCIIPTFKSKKEYYSVLSYICHENLEVTKATTFSRIWESVSKKLGKLIGNIEIPGNENFQCVAYTSENKDNNSKCNVIAAYPKELKNSGIIEEGRKLFFKYFIVTTYEIDDLKLFIPKNNTINEAILDKIVNSALLDKNLSFMVPLAELSLGTVAKEKFKSIDKVFKLPDSKLVHLKFIDNRDLVKKNSLETLGYASIPDELSAYVKPEKGVLYNGYGETPDYIKGMLPNATGELKSKDYYGYQYRLATKYEIKDKNYDKEIPSENNDITFYLKRVALKEAKVYNEILNKVFWTDFENELVFYYNSEGFKRVKSIQGFQDISDKDIQYLGTSAYINLNRILYPTEASSGWYNNEDTKKDAEELKRLIDVLVKDVKNISPYKGLGEEFQEEIRFAEDYKFRSGTIQKFSESKRLLTLIGKFFELYGTADGCLESNTSTFAISALISSGINIKEISDKIQKEEEEHRKIAEDVTGKTPNIPKNIKNFSTDKTLFAQQAIALSMSDKQKVTLLDVDMGGGKTCMMVADILNQMTKGKIKRPIIVCPDNTIPQNKKEILNKWTDNRINIFVINTDTYKRYFNYDQDKLREAVEKMPPNTIYMTSYTFLIRDRLEVATSQTKDKAGNPIIEYTDVFPIPRMLIKDLGFDMVYCDESHYIKNPNSFMSRAVAAMSSAPYKRITSGTIIPNNPADLFAQLRFLDPTILGREEDFYKKYAEIVATGKNVRKWKIGAQKEIRRLIQSRGGVSIRRSMWRWMMPNLIEKVHFVQLTEIQQKMYENIMGDIKAEISGSKELREAAENLAIEGDEEKESLALLSKLNRFTSYLAAPGTDPIINKLEKQPKFTKIDIIGPKILEMNNILKDHFSQGFDDKGNPKNGKVIVFCQRVDVARHALNYMDTAFQSHAVWYRAGMTKELYQFKNNSNIWIIVAVEQSIKEGQNLQVANRIIRLDIPWTPGDLDQSYARAFRTGQKKDVNVDIIICDKTMEVTKYLRLISKEYINKKLTSEFDDNESSDNKFIPVVMNMDNMEDERYTNKENTEDYIEMHKKISKFEIKESNIYRDKYKNYKESGISKVGSTEDLEGSKIVATPELQKDRIEIDENGELKSTKQKYNIEDVGVDITKLDNNEGNEEDLKTKVEEQNVEGNIHLYFLDQDDSTYLMTTYNKTS